MNLRPGWQQRLFLLVEWLKGFRYIKFGLVGASGTVVNLAVLYGAHEYLFRAIEPEGSRPYASLALAIAIATVNNFTWNRLWTWSDRVKRMEHAEGGPPGQPTTAGQGIRPVRDRLGLWQRLAIRTDAAAVGLHGLPRGQHHCHCGRQREQLSGQ